MRYAISTDVFEGLATQVVIEAVDNVFNVVATRTWAVPKHVIKGVVSYRNTLPDWAL